MSTVVVSESLLSQKDWDAFVERNGVWSLFQTYEWGEVQKALKCEIKRLVLYQGKELVGIVQVIVVRAKRGIFLHLRHGPVFSTTSSVYANWKALLEYMRQYSREVGAWFIRVSPMIADTEESRKLLHDFGFHPSPIQAMDAEVCWVLDTSIPEEEILRNMRKTTRYLIRQGEKSGIKITQSEQIEEFLKLYTETAKRHQFIPHKGIREEYEVFKKTNKALLLFGSFENELLAGAVILFFGQQAIYHHGASLTSKIPAAYGLQWNAILEAKRRGATMYNFWGIAPADKPRHPWRGITLFKQGFGGKEMRFVHAHDLPLSSSYIMTRVIESMRRKWRGY